MTKVAIVFVLNLGKKLMKVITEERILKAHDRLNKYRWDEIQEDSKKVCILATLGMQTMCDKAFGVETPKHESDRTRLELQFIEKPLTPKDRLELIDRWSNNLQKRNDIRDKIAQIQISSGISGIVRDSFSLGDREFLCWTEHQILSLIESDLEAFRSEIDSHVQEFLTYCILRALKPWRYFEHDWIPCQFSDVVAECQLFDWVRIWEDKTYTSPEILNTKGHDTVRTVPKHDDDELSWEVHIEACRGTDRIESPSIEFCCSNTKPYL